MRLVNLIICFYRCISSLNKKVFEPCEGAFLGKVFYALCINLYFSIAYTKGES